MSRRDVSVIARHIASVRRITPVVLALLSWGGSLSCGGEELSGSQMRVGLSTAGLVANVVVVRIAVHRATRSCSEIEVRCPAFASSYHLDLQLSKEGQKSGGTTTINGIREGEYNIAVWGALQNGTVIAFGCEPVSVKDGERADVTVALGSKDGC